MAYVLCVQYLTFRLIISFSLHTENEYPVLYVYYLVSFCLTLLVQFIFVMLYFY